MLHHREDKDSDMSQGIYVLCCGHFGDFGQYHNKIREHDTLWKRDDVKNMRWVREAC